ncbi:hypothetical protein AAC387_Pa01g2655 [Persea americana]
MAFWMQRDRIGGRKTSLQLGNRFAGPTIEYIERNLPLAYRHRLPPHLASMPVDLDPFTLPLGWTRFIDLNTGRVHYKRDISFAAAAAEDMGWNGRWNPQQDFKENLTTLPPLIDQHLPDSPTQSMSASFVSPGSCVSSEFAEEADTKEIRPPSSPPEVTSLVLKGCRCCHMYVMLKEEQEPKCPKCKSPDLLDFLKENSKNNIMNSSKKMRKE